MKKKLVKKRPTEKERYARDRAQVLTLITEIDEAWRLLITALYRLIG
jgi:hypothetical protein